MGMTSRERLLAAMAHQPLDRVPISTYELVGWNANAWENREPSYRRLMDAIRDQTDCIYMINVDWKAQPSGRKVTSRSWREGASQYFETTWHTPNGDLTSRHRIDDNVHTTWTLEHLLKTVEDIDKYLSVPWEPPQADMTRFYAEQAALGDRGVMMITVGDPICEAAELFEMGTFLVHAITEPVAVRRLLDAIHERQMHNLRQILRHDVRNVIFRICGPEYATPPYLSPDHFRWLVTPYLTDICAAIRSAGGFARVHCHGKIGEVLEQIVAAGAEGLDPIEPPPDGDITLGAVKHRYGSQLTLFGNMELKELENAEPMHIAALVKQAMCEAKANGGFVLMPTAAPINVPLSPRTEGNYLAFIEAGLQYGQY